MCCHHTLISLCLFQTTVVEVKQSDYESPASLPKNHFIISIVLLIVSVINPLVLMSCAIPAVVFSCLVSYESHYCQALLISCVPQARQACEDGDKEAMRSNDKTSFAFIIFGIIGWIITVCVTGFAVHAVRCGLTGQLCITKPYPEG